jgi:hypothetical protein
MSLKDYLEGSSSEEHQSEHDALSPALRKAKALEEEGYASSMLGYMQTALDQPQFGWQPQVCSVRLRPS